MSDQNTVEAPEQIVEDVGLAESEKVSEEITPDDQNASVEAEGISEEERERRAAQSAADKEKTELAARTAEAERRAEEAEKKLAEAQKSAPVEEKPIDPLESLDGWWNDEAKLRALQENARKDKTVGPAYNLLESQFRDELISREEFNVRGLELLGRVAEKIETARTLDAHGGYIKSIEQKEAESHALNYATGIVSEVARAHLVPESEMPEFRKFIKATGMDFDNPASLLSMVNPQIQESVKWILAGQAALYNQQKQLPGKPKLVPAIKPDITGAGEAAGGGNPPLNFEQKLAANRKALLGS